MHAMMGQDIIDDYGVFGVSEDELPQSLNIYRAHLSKVITTSLDINGSFLMSEAALLLGWGAGINYNFFKALVFYTSMNFRYSQNQVSDFFETTNYTLGLAQTVNLRWIDLYVGIDYIWGDFEFFSGNDASVPVDVKQISTDSLDKMRKYAGIVVALGKKLRATAQVNTTNYEAALVLKVSLKWAKADDEYMSDGFDDIDF
ncbi:MAG: hypothetical protein ISR65_04445 [Bacteriovoracaceae bacterium]|nr:hypothetical protein [Bacteriovoracaceae bacterium]